jgi:ATP-dependent DNA ligase
MEEVTWIEPKLVCKVIYQVVTRGCRLRMPRLHRIRIEKDPANCTINQIEGKENAFPNEAIKGLKTNKR